MPDLQSEIFTKVLPNLNNLSFDDKGESEETAVPDITFTTQENMPPLTRQVFDFIKANHKCKGPTVLDHFTAAGYKRSVVAATVTALIKTSRVERPKGRLVTTRNDYDRPKVAKATAKVAEPMQNNTTPPKFDIDGLLSTLTMYDGRELYNRLKAIYGG